MAATHRNIKVFFLSLLIAAITVSCTKEQPKETSGDPATTTFILVRHAEKADDGTDDPPLNETREVRAEKLADHLKETDITAIYSTNYKRTMQTVQAIADSSGLEIKPYDPFTENTLSQIIDSESGGTVLISGHSNTTPLLVNELIGEDRYQQFDDADYDNIFIVTTSEIGKGNVLKINF